MTCNDCTHYAGNGKCRKNKKGTTSPLKVADELKFFEAAEPEKPVLPETKICKGCGRELPLDAYGRNRQGPLGYCKDCMAAKRKAAMDNKKRLDEASQSFQEELDRVAPIEPFKEPEPSLVGLLQLASDDELVAELRRRGWSGTLTRSETINI